MEDEQKQQNEIKNLLGNIANVEELSFFLPSGLEGTLKCLCSFILYSVINKYSVMCLLMCSFVGRY